MAIRNSKGQFIKNTVGKDAGRWKGGKIKRICKNCNQEYEAHPSVNKKFCSHSCYAKSLIGKHFKWNHKRRTPVWNEGKKMPEISGKNHWNWKGGFYINDSGYKVFNSNAVNDGKKTREHRLIVEKHLGRNLKKNEHIHHIDGNKLNNDIKNLLIVNPTDHQRIHRLGKKFKNGYKKK